jgi:hypothetical protein
MASFSFGSKNLTQSHLNTISTVGMLFAVLSEDGVTAFKERMVKTHALDDLSSVVGVVAAGFHRRRRGQLDSPAFADCFGSFSSSVNYRKTGRRLTLIDGACHQLRLKS